MFLLFGLRRMRQPTNILRSSDSACNFAGTKATSTCINSLGRAVHYSLDPFNVGLPGSVWTSVRMGNLDAERHILTAIFAFCHVSHLLFYSVTDDMIADCRQKSKLFFIFYGSLCEKLENGRRPCYNRAVKSRDISTDMRIWRNWQTRRI